MTYWQLLILSLPAGNATARQRAWRALKAAGAAVLRDGAYLLPDAADHRALLAEVAADVRENGGTAHLLRVEAPADADFTALFDRTEEYAVLRADIGTLRQHRNADPTELLRETRRLRRRFETLAITDHFAGASRRETADALADLERFAARALSADEPQDGAARPARLLAADFHGRRWATRRRPWVDRLASAWLIRRHIDPRARLLWLDSVADCPADAVGFDFDGAAFTHAGGKVTFEMLAESFGLAALPGIARLARVVHHLDVGGAAPPEAAGIETVLAGLRSTLSDDDALLDAAMAIFDALNVRYSEEAAQ